MRSTKLLALVLVTGFLLAACRSAEAPYKVGFSADVTGPAAGTFAPVQEGFRIYIRRLNDHGGINGRRIELVGEDNRSDGTKAAADAKKFADQDRVHMIVNSASSVTFAPMIAQAEDAGVPMVVAEPGCPREVYPPSPKPIVFCFLNSHTLDNEFTPRFIEKTAQGPVKWAGAAFDVPVSRSGIDQAEAVARRLGLEVVGKEVLPLGPANFDAHASRLIAAGATWVQGWGIWERTGAPLLEALRRQGWQGSYIHVAMVFEDELSRLKDSRLYLYSPRAFFAEDLPVHREIREAAQQYNAAFPATQLSGGWIMGMIAEESFRRCGWPCPRGRLLEVMQGLEVDTQGLTAFPIRWTPQDHFGPVAYRVYRWDSAQGKVVRIGDWAKPGE